MPAPTDVVDSWALPGFDGALYCQLHADGGLFDFGGLDGTKLRYTAYRADGAFYNFGPDITPGIISYPGLPMPPRQPGVSYFVRMHVLAYDGINYEHGPTGATGAPGAAGAAGTGADPAVAADVAELKAKVAKAAAALA